MEQILNLSLNQLLDVKSDLDLHKKGYIFIYVIDTFEVINYHFPFLRILSQKSGVKRTSGKMEIRAQQGVAYNYFFSDTGKRFFFPPEYYSEIISIKAEFDEKIKNAADVLESIEQSFLDNQIPPNEIRERINNNLELIVYTLIEIEKIAVIKKNNIIGIFGLFKDRLSYEDRIIYDRYVELDYQHQLSENVIDEYISKLNLKVDSMLENLSSDSPSSREGKILRDKIKNIKNTRIDIRVIDRVAQLNNLNDTLYREGKLDDKQKFVYLSSAATKNMILFKQPSLGKLISDNNSSPQSLLRNINQVFLFDFLLNKEAQSADFDAINYMDNELITSFLSRPKDPIKIEVEKEKIENYFYQDIYNKKYEETRKAVQGNFSSIYIYIKEVNNQLRESSLLPSSPLGYQIKFQNNLDENPLNYFVKPGKDIIKSPLQHFPNLLGLFLFNNSDNKIYGLLNFLADQNNLFSFGIKANLTHLPSDILYDFKKHHDTITSPLNEEYFNVIRNILILLCKTSFELEEISNIWFSSSDKRNLELLYNDEVEFFDYLLVCRSTIQKNVSHIEVNEEDLYLMKTLVQELDYLIFSFSRRLGRESNTLVHYRKEKMIDLYEEYVKKYPEDFRFSHLKVLYLINQYYEFKKDEKQYYLLNSNLINEIDKCLISIDNYIKEDTGGYDRRALIQKIRLALRNSRLNSFVEYLNRSIDFSTPIPEEKVSILISSRKLLDEIKKESKRILVNYDSVFSFNHSEAVLEYLEAHYTYYVDSENKSSISYALIKLEHAGKRTFTFGSDVTKLSKEFIHIRDKIFDLKNTLEEKLKVNS